MIGLERKSGVVLMLSEIGGSMGRPTRLLVVCLVLCVVTAMGRDRAALAESTLLTGSPLVISDSPVESEQLRALEEARLDSPEAVSARGESQTAYSGYGVTESEELVGRLFHAFIDEPDGGLPKLPEGEQVSSFSSPFSAALELPGGKRGALESVSPIAVEDPASGQLAPIDLTPRQVGSGFEAVRPLAGVHVRVGGQLSEGASFSDSGVTLTPVTEDGVSLEASGAIDGAGVFYGDSEDAQAGVQDVDTLAKLDTYGFSEETILRSSRSPQKLFFKVGLPEDASLSEAKDGSGDVLVIDAGRTVAAILGPGAYDAEGTALPVSMSVSGDVLVLTVARQLGQYRYPIVVDPTVEDKEIHAGFENDNWTSSTNNSSAFTFYGKSTEMEIETRANYIAGQYGYFVYPTQKESHIFEWKATTSEEFANELQATLSLASPGSGKEGSEVSLPTVGTNTASTVCAVSTCEVGSVTSANKENRAFMELHAIEAFKCCFSSKVVGKTPVAIYIVQEKGPSAKMDTIDATVKGISNPLHTGEWTGPKTALWVNAFDPGIGLKKGTLKSPQAPSWSAGLFGDCAGAQCDECYENECLTGVKSTPWEAVLGSGLVDGEDTIEGSVEDGVGLKASTAQVKIKYDGTPPSIELTGLPSSHEINEGTYQLKAKATDGSGTTPSSGVASIALTIDGVEVGKAGGSCSPGPCSAENEWAISGEEFGAGQHILSVIATDKVGNVKTETITVTVHVASPLTLGPGSVDPVTGGFSIGTTDVSIPAPGASLSVARAYNSQYLSAGALGPMGGQWSMGLSGHASVTFNGVENAVLTGISGERVIFTKSEGKYVAPRADANLTLTLGSGKVTLRNASTGDSTVFEKPGTVGSVWMPTIQEGLVPSETVTFAYQVVEVEGHKVVQATEALAPVPRGVSCSPSLSKGCRALTFNYATSTTATGEAPSEWGDYNGHLTRVYLTAWDPAKKEMTTTAVAQYTYDKKGQLRAEWDPRISPALKTTYGYDPEGRVTAISPPGREPWLFDYGTIAGRGEAKGLLSVVRPSASTALASSPLPQNTVLPTLSSTTPAVGSKISVSSNGTWTYSPLYYSYQWEDCNSSGAECVPIAGAVNQSYYPVTSDEKHKLVAQVRALNADGVTAVLTAATGLVAAGTPNSPAPEPPSLGSSAAWTVDYQVPVSGTGAPYNMSSGEVEKWGQKEVPTEATAIFPPDEPMGWPARDYKRATVSYLDVADHAVNTVAPTGGISTTEYNSQNDVVRALSPDNRASSLKEGAKSAEVAKLLDVQSAYNTEGNELLETLGPRHMVKLPNGKEVQARNRTNYIYDEGAPTEGGPYRLVTKMTQSAETETEGEQDVRTTKTSYSGQENLGWRLRKPTSVTIDPVGLKLTTTTLYDPETGNVIEIRSPSGGTGNVPGGSYTYSSQVTGGGSGASVTLPEGVTADQFGHIWVVDTGNSRVQEFSSGGLFIRQFGSEGTENGRFKKPTSVAVDSKEDVWVTDAGNNRVQEFSSTGTYIRQFGKEGTENGQFKGPAGIAIDNKGNLWVVDSGNKRVQEFSATGTYLARFGSEGTENGQFKAPSGILVTSTENIWVTDTGNNRVQEFSSTGTYLAKFGSEGTENGQFKKPRGIATDSKGNLWIIDNGNNRVEEFSSVGVYISKFGAKGTGNGQFESPVGIAVDPGGHLWVTEIWKLLPGRVQELSQGGEYLGMAWNATVELKEPEGVAISGEKMWVTNSGANRIEEFSTGGTYALEFGSVGTGNGQFKKPGSVAIDPKGNIWVLDTGNNRVQEFSPTGEYTRQFGSEGTGNGQFKTPHSIAVDSKEDVWVTDTGNNRVQEFSSTGTYIRQFSAFGPLGIGVDSGGHEWVALLGVVEEFSSTGEKLGKFITGGINDGVVVDSTGNVWVTDSGKDHVQEFAPATGEKLNQFGTEGTGSGQFKTPGTLAIGAGGQIWVADTRNNRIQQFLETPGGPHSSQTIYYTVKEEASVGVCGNHPEWANLPCRIRPTSQPPTGNPLPVINETYNMLDEPETITEAFGTNIRTKKTTYDAAGGTLTSSTSAAVGTSLPTVTDEYNSETGVLARQSTTVSEKTQSISSVFNTLGQMTSYTDADGNVSTYNYDIDGRTEKTNDGKGTQTITYDTTTGLLTKLVDSAAGTFTATYDVEGNLTSESYPNAMSANYTYDATGKAIKLQYVKNAHCAGTCPETWYSDSIAPSIHGQSLSQTSSLAGYNYVYDGAGRLTQTQDTPSGKGCVTRIYAYDEETNRLSATTRAPNAESKCASEGGTIEKHTYDAANRLTDTGVTYDIFGNTTKLPASDAGGSELTSEFYNGNQLKNQTQNGQTIGYNLDPAGRTRETVSTGKVTATEIDHYSGPTSSPAWTGEISGNWTRNISGISGNLVAIQHNGETPELQVSNLHGDITATASDSEAATTLSSTTAEASEFGVPATEAPPKYSWLGARELPTMLTSGTIAMGARSYIPQLGRFLQDDPIPGGSANAYAYTYGDPVNSFDPSGAYTATIDGYDEGYVSEKTNAAVATREAEIHAAEEAALREEAERKAAEAALQAAMPVDSPEPKWIEEYAMGGPSLLEIDASEGIVPGGGMVEEGGGSGRLHLITDSGDGCGDGKYCKGEWVGPSEHGHRHGEHIGGSPWEPADAICILYGWTPICWAYGSVRTVTKK